MSSAEFESYISRDEDHFFDRKSAKIKPAKLSQSFSALANADGGEIFVGLEDDGTFVGFDSVEDTNEITQVAAEIMSLRYYSVEFLSAPDSSGIGALFTIERHPGLIKSTSDNVYQRNGAQNRSMIGADLEALRRAKGEARYELTTTDTKPFELENSVTMLTFMLEGRAFAEPREFLHKQLLVQDGQCTVAGVLLFSDLPQAHLPSSAVKIYRYKTSGEESRDHLDGMPETIEGPLIGLIAETRDRVSAIISEIPRLKEDDGFESLKYPTTALHEILTNAFLHRDYGIADYVHVRIFDNRIEVDSPGRLHGHVTVQNILSERSARNPLIQRVINKFPEAPNQDIGEGLNSAFAAMEEVRLRLPVIEELSDRVRVTISHEPLASPQKTILETAIKNGSINNSEAQEATKVAQERTIRRYFEQLVASGQLVRDGSGRGTRYSPTEAAIEAHQEENLNG
ncbi:hypothetical protein AFL94_11070 [Arthrobacter sp. LS16]|nr:hypothetical protein AFL94_11070 [Arthrobacter sp. LS16]